MIILVYVIPLIILVLEVELSGAVVNLRYNSHHSENLPYDFFRGYGTYLNSKEGRSSSRSVSYMGAKVSSFRLGDPNISEGEKGEAGKLTEEYFKPALVYAKEL